MILLTLKKEKKALKMGPRNCTRLCSGTAIQEVILHIKIQIYANSYVHRTSRWWFWGEAIPLSIAPYGPILLSVNYAQTPLFIQSIDDERTVRKAVMNEIWNGGIYVDFSDSLKKTLVSQAEDMIVQASSPQGFTPSFCKLPT
jgi:hypothetical protein